MKRTIILSMAVLFMVTGLYAGVSDHVLKIELATTYEYGAPGDELSYVFDASIQVDESIVSGTMEDPNGDVNLLELEEDGSERWLCFSQESPDLDDLDNFMYGTFTFTVEYSDTSTESTSIDYATGDGYPISPVTQQPQFSYPTHNATDAPPALTYLFDAASDPNWDITLEWEPEPDGSPGRAGEVDNLPYDTTSYGPVILSPDTLYSVGMAINNAIETVNSDGIPAVMDKDAETHIYFTTASGVLFPEYFPLEATSHGLKTLQWTYGKSGSYLSYISGKLTVPYTSGPIEGAGIVNFSDIGTGYATNDGNEVKWLASDYFYISTDCNLTAHPTAWAFSTVTDDMILDQGTYYFVDHNLIQCEMDNKQSLLFDIQDVNVPFGQYNNAVIIWYIDEEYTYTALDFDGKDIDLGIALPNGAQTNGNSVTAFDVYAYGIGMIAYGDIGAETGELYELAELVDHVFSGFYGGGSGEPNDPYLIYDANQMNSIGANPGDWDKCFKLMADIDLSGITYTTAVIAFDTDYSSPFSFDGVPFTGEFDGNGYRILNLTIDTEGLDKDYLGLFGLISEGAVVYNLGLEDVNVSGSGNWVNGDFTGDFGALVGDNSGVIKNCWISGSVKGGNFSEDVGGLCGWNQITGSITRSYVMGSVICGTNSGGIGGLCGSNDGSITDCWSSSSVTGRNSLGGLCGYLCGGSIVNSYSTGSVTGTTEWLGGLIGEYDGGTITNCFWDVNTSGQETSAGGEGKTTAEMQEPNTFIDAGWDFATPIWMICGQDYPRLIWNYPDVDGSGMVDFSDYSKIAAYWLTFDCGMCGHTDLTGDRDIDNDDLRIFVDSWLDEDGVCDHVFGISIEMAWDYQNPNNPNDTRYEFSLEAVTDGRVERIEFLAPSGNLYEIPNIPYQRIDGIRTSYEYDAEENIYAWDYDAGFDTPNDLAAYGDGEYTITIYYDDVRQDQTVVWFGEPNTNDPILQPTQLPVFTSFTHGYFLTSPVTIEWQDCNDPAANLIWVGLETEITPEEDYDFILPVDANALDEPLALIEGLWKAGLGYEVWYQIQNSDGIDTWVGKYSESDYLFTVVP